MECDWRGAHGVQQYGSGFKAVGTQVVIVLILSGYLIAIKK